MFKGRIGEYSLAWVPAKMPNWVCYRMRLRALNILVIAVALLQTTAAIRVEVKGSDSVKCVTEDILQNVIALVDFSVVDHNITGQAVSVQATSPYGASLYSSENVPSGHFGFTTHESGEHTICFSVSNAAEGVITTIDFDWKMGLAAKDWSTIAKKEKIEGVELDMARLHDLVDTIHENLVYLKQKELEMRSLNESTNSKVAWLSILALVVCIVSSVVQLFLLKQYFVKKKLI